MLKFRLGHFIEVRGIGLLTGEVGSGKTTVYRHLTAQLHPGLYRVQYVSLTTGNVLDMYKSIAWEIGITVERSRSSAHHAIRTEISRLAKEAKQLPVLIVTRPATCATTASRTFACSPTSPWMRSSACA